MSRMCQFLACAALLSAVVVRAQAPDGTSPPSSASSAASTPPAIDPTKLGVSFDRVRMQLSQPVPEKDKGLKLRETIDVVGKAPPILLWDPKTVKANLTSAAVPFGAPTQKDIMKLIVPKEFQNYPMDLNALMEWLTQHLSKKSE